MMACGKSGHKENFPIESQEPEEQKEIDLMEMDEAFYVALLDSFCYTYYEQYLPGHYVRDSLRIIGVSSKDTHTVEVTGTHSFKGRDFKVYQKPYDNVYFVATVNYCEDDEYFINFSRQLEIPEPLKRFKKGEWKYTGELPFKFEYSPVNNSTK